MGSRVDLLRPDFDAFAAAGAEADPSVLLVGTRKMGYSEVADPETGTKVPDRTRLVYNPHFTLTDIPLRAHDYVLGTRSGIDGPSTATTSRRTRLGGPSTTRTSGLERGEPRYIVDLVKRVVTVSLRTVEIVDSLPRLRF